MFSIQIPHLIGLGPILGRATHGLSRTTLNASRWVQPKARWGGSLTLVASVLLSIGLTPGVKAQSSGLEGFESGQPTTLPSNVQIVTPDVSQSGLFSIPAGKRVMSEAAQAVAAQNYELAASKYQDSRRLMNQLSKFYDQLRASFLAIDNRASDSNRKKALEAAELRDQATYKLGLVYVAQNKPEKAIPLFIEIVRSQNPTRDLGEKSYQQLFELGFVDVPYPRNAAPAASGSGQ